MRENVAQCERYLQLAEEASSDAAKRQWLEQHGRALMRLARLTGEEPMPEAQVVKHPAFTRVLDVIFGVLEKHPDVLRELRAALAQAGVDG